MDRCAIGELLKDAPIGAIQKVQPLSGGHSSAAWRVSATAGEFVLLVPSGASVLDKKDYAHEYVFLKTLETCGYQQAPRAVFLGKDHQSLLMNFAAGTQPSMFANAAASQRWQVTQALLRALHDLRSVPHAAYVKAAAAANVPPLPISSLQDDTIQFVQQRFLQAAEKGQPDPAFRRWLEPKVAATMQHVQSAATGAPTLSHGDTSDGNILVTSDMQLTLIDWQYARFNSYPPEWDDHGIAFLLNHIDICADFRDKMITQTAQRAKTDASELRRAVQKRQELIKIGDIVWAYLMHATAQPGSAAATKYHKLTQARIAGYQQLVARPRD